MPLFKIIPIIAVLLLAGCATSHPEIRVSAANGKTTATLEVWQSTPMPDYGERDTTATLSIRDDGSCYVNASTKRTKSTMGGFITALFGFLAGLFAKGAVV